MENPGLRYHNPVFSTHGNLIAWVRGLAESGSEHIVITDLARNCHIDLPVEAGVIWLGSWSPDGTELIFSTTDSDYIIDLSQLPGLNFQKAGTICS